MRCKCGCAEHYHQAYNITMMQSVLNTVRAFWGSPIYVNSWFRCKTHNKNVGGASKSTHMYGIATDIKPIEGDLKAFINMLNVLQARKIIPKLNIIEYNTFVHIDLRNCYENK